MLDVTNEGDRRRPGRIPATMNKVVASTDRWDTSTMTMKMTDAPPHLCHLGLVRRPTECSF